MTLRKKVTASTLAVSMLAAVIGGIPLSQKGLTEKLGFIEAVNAAETELPSSGFLQRMQKLHDALAAGSPQDVQDVRDLRDEIAGLDESENQNLIDPIWNKISKKLPDSVDQAELKASLFRFVNAVGSFRYDAGAADLEAIRTNAEFRATLKTIAAAGGDANITMDDFLVFLFGDGGNRKGIEGTISSELGNMSSLQILSLLGNSQGITNVVLQATDKLLSDKKSYKFSKIFDGLGIKSQDIRSMVSNFQLKLKKDEAAMNAITVAYIRSEAVAVAKISEGGLRHDYSLKVFGVDIPKVALKWAKVSGSEDVSVLPNGTVQLSPEAVSGSVVIRASLVNPYGGSAKVIFEQEITLTAAEGAQDVFPVEPFLERMNKLQAALLAGDSNDIKDVRRLLEELAGLNQTKHQALIDPIWNKIVRKLPNTADAAQVKASLFEIIKAVGSVHYDPKASNLESIMTNPQYQDALKTIAAAAKVKSLTVDDFLIFMFGDGDKRLGVEGEIKDSIKDMKPRDLTELFGRKSEINEIKIDAMEEILSEKDDYTLSKVLSNLGVRFSDVESAIENIQDKLNYDESASKAMTAAYLRSETVSTVKVTANGKHHEYSLTVFGTKLPTSVLKWKKVSGSKDVKVESQGKVSIPNKVAEGTAVIQASLVASNGGSAKVLFEQEVKLVNGDAAIDPEKEIKNIVVALEEKLDEIKVKLEAAKDDKQKVELIMEVVLAGNDAVDQINRVEASKAIKNKALNEVKTQVSKMVALIIEDVLGF